MKAKRIIAAIIALALLCMCAPALAQSTYAETPLGASSENKIYNIEKVARTLNGWVLLGGETFSFNEAVGPRSADAGFRNAENGRGVKVRGGGVAQVASTLYLALKGADGLTVTSKRTYGESYNQNYVSDPDDAIVTDYGAGTDFCFRNDRAEPVEIGVYIDSAGFLRCEIRSIGAWDDPDDWDDGFDWNEDEWFTDEDGFFDEGDGQWVLGEDGEWIWESAWEWLE